MTQGWQALVSDEDFLPAGDGHLLIGYSDGLNSVCTQEEVSPLSEQREFVIMSWMEAKRRDLTQNQHARTLILNCEKQQWFKGPSPRHVIADQENNASVLPFLCLWRGLSLYFPGEASNAPETQRQQVTETVSQFWTLVVRNQCFTS